LVKKNKKVVVVAIAGASGSGKSSLASAIMKNIPEAATISEDSYYKDLSHINPYEKRLEENFDHPRSLEHDLLIQHIKALNNGEGVDVPIYDYTTCTRKKEATRVENCLVLIIEGILVLSDKKLRNLCDIRIYIDAPMDLCLTRRLQRDVVERNLPIDVGIKQYMDNTRPMFLKYVEPSKKHAHILVPKGGHNRVAINVVKNMLIKLINDATEEQDQ